MHCLVEIKRVVQNTCIVLSITKVFENKKYRYIVLKVDQIVCDCSHFMYTQAQTNSLTIPSCPCDVDVSVEFIFYTSQDSVGLIPVTDIIFALGIIFIFLGSEC